MTGRDSRLAIGPANFAGQAFAWAESVRDHLATPAFSFAHRRNLPLLGRRAAFDFSVHSRLPHHRVTSRAAKKWWLRGLTKDVTHLAVDGFLPLTDRLDRGRLGLELSYLREQDFELALVAHGTDVRDPDSHMSRLPFSYYREDSSWTQLARVRSRENRRLSEESGLRTFVSTPDLLLDLPHAIWLPLTVDLGYWGSVDASPPTSRPVVVHVPSRRSPPIKGTAVIDPVLRSLHAQGEIVYLSPSEKLSRNAMRSLVERADVVVDQVMSGCYGVAAVEGMAAGRLVVGYVDDEVRSLMPEDPPVVDAPPAQFEEVMGEIARDWSAYQELRRRGPVFVSRWHGGEAAARSLENFLCNG